MPRRLKARRASGGNVPPMGHYASRALPPPPPQKKRVPIMVFSSRSSEEEDDRVRAPSRRVKVPAPARVAKNSSRLHASQVPPRQLREKGKQVMEQLMKNYPACLDVEDDVDYSPIVEPLFRQVYCTKTWLTSLIIPLYKNHEKNNRENKLKK